MYVFGEEEGMVCEVAVMVVVPGPGCPPAKSTWPGLHLAALRSHSATPPEIHRAAGGERRRHEARTPPTQILNQCIHILFQASFVRLFFRIRS